MPAGVEMRRVAVSLVAYRPLALLATTELYLVKTTRAKLRIAVSK
jgi:hypothetical protein